jgi:hypothetical protein
VHSNRTKDEHVTRIGDVVEALDDLTGGRLSAPPGPDNPWHVTKSSGLPGKSVLETPGLVIGHPDAPVRRMAVAMTLTEHDIELARATNVDLIVAHHPVADAASSGGVSLADYLGPYKVGVIECHEAFHGLHPGIGYLHGHTPIHHDGAFGGNHGKVVMIGQPLAGVETLGDVLARLRTMLGREIDESVLEAEREARGLPDLADSVNAPGLRILHGTPNTRLGELVIHAFPHTGFSSDDLESLLSRFPSAGTLILSISSGSEDDDYVRLAAERGLAVLVGSSHATEILENGLPLATALGRLFPDVEVLLFRSRVVALPVAGAAEGQLGMYGQLMGDHLLAATGRRTA